MNNYSAEMAGISRRAILKSGAAFAALAAVAGSRAFAQGTTTIKWWDIFQPLIPLHTKMWEDYAADHPISVDYTGMNPSDMMQALQLAVRSNQAPDVFNVPSGDPATLASLNAADWFAPLDDSFVFDKPYQQQTLAEGFTQFGGKLYSFPIFSFRWHSTSLWHSKPALEAVGASLSDTANWDDIRAAAKAATTDGKYGLLLPLQFTARIADHLTDLAMAAGAPGRIDWRTGEYALASDEFVAALDFWLSFQKDGSLHPASASLDARQGRSRWAAGEAAMFFDGPWNSGVLTNNFADFLEGVEVTPLPTPAGVDKAYAQRPPIPGTFFISSQSEHAKEASEVMQLMTTEEYYVALAERMDQPPLDLDAVAKANVHPTYRKAVAGFADSVRLAPDPLIRNPDVAKVYAEMRDITPGLGEIIQGAFSGSFDDPRPILQDLADQMTAERDRAIKVATDNGAKVSVDDWVFDNWTPGTDYTSDMY
ncbi:extracellular solute-binding protein [Devosia algicola]|uniref:sn-glycerol-3-phosphate-binding periplasmic protein UgpB n=1 Tax=Devosia algicola TaxID=3026418 RepID=A0ABY7YKK8_9HYPH|nr:extracellular solute-binding protein [Devosia algicola]WDR01500.1 extracellular solute-binding protein [Devosia algicola]